MNAKTGCDLLVVSHPAVLKVNQLPYEELARRGFRVELFIPATWRHEYSTATFRPESVPLLWRHAHRRSVLFAGKPQRHLMLTNTLAQIRRFGAKAVFCEQEPFSVAATQWGLAASALGVPFGIAIDENLDRPMPAIARLMRSQTLNRAAFVAARSNTAGDLAKKWGAKGDVRLIPHHVPSWPTPDRTPNERFVVGFAGRLVPEKDLATLVDAIRLLEQPVDLLVVGDGPLRGWLESADLGSSKLRLVRGTDHGEMAELYASMDVLVLPSLTTAAWVEQFGRVLVEAMSCGTPVIGSDSGEIPWVIKTTGGGLVFPEGDAPALAQLLTAMREDPILCRQLATQGRSTVDAQFTVAAVADRFEEVLSDVVGIRRPPPRKKPVVALVAHDLAARGGMEVACAEVIERSGGAVDFVAVSTTLAPELRPMVRSWVQVKVPSRPLPVKFVSFWFRGGRAVRMLETDESIDYIQTVGAIIPNRVDFAWVHLCHAGLRAATGRFAPAAAPHLRRINTATSRLIGVAAERWSYRPGKVRSLLAVSAGVAAELGHSYPDVPVTVVPNGVDLTRFHPDRRARETLRADQNVGESVVALFVGGDWDHKGLDLAIEAVAQSRADGSDLSLWVVGRGDTSRFVALAEATGVGNHVRFFGYREDVELLYQAADIFVLPSQYETFSLACFEAAASGLPLVITQIHGARELVGAEEGGVVVQRSGPSLSDALTKLAENAELRAQQGSSAARAAARFSWDHCADAFIDLYAKSRETVEP